MQQQHNDNCIKLARVANVAAIHMKANISLPTCAPIPRSGKLTKAFRNTIAIAVPMIDATVTQIVARRMHTATGKAIQRELSESGDRNISTNNSSKPARNRPNMV